MSIGRTLMALGLLMALPLSALAGSVDLNQANAEALEALPGIGSVKAERILEYRDQNGAFQQVEDLTNVDGIGPATLEKLRPELTVGNSDS